MTMLKKCLRYLVRITVIFAVLAAVAAILSYIFIPYNNGILAGLKKSQVIFDRNGNVLRALLTEDDEWCFYVSLDAVSPHMKNAVMAAEDKRFYSHDGVDIAAVLRAAYYNTARLKTVSGASTIPMQVIKLLEGRNDRNIVNKIIESVKALKMSAEVEKDFILELYLNITPYGRNLRGVEAAAMYYFGKHSDGLSLSEAALLAGLPKSPSYLRPDRHPDRAIRRRNFVLKRMLELAMITREEYDESASEPLRLSLNQRTFLAPHFTDFVHRLYPDRETVRTTLDMRLQEILQSEITSTVRDYLDYGITNGAGIVLENKTGAVRAYVGSEDFADDRHNGKIDGVRMKRSPGSALKPFIYCLGIDKGLFSPGTVFYDIPVVFNGYSPVNYEMNYSGPVTLRDALSRSLNIPAVSALQRTGVGDTIELLRRCGVTYATGLREQYGLSLALGAAEISPLEIATAYSALANMGIFVPYTCTVPEGETEGDYRKRYNSARVLSAESAYIITDILSDENRLPPLMRVNGTKTAYPRIAWKTGTSFGNKDTWCIGYNPEFTVCLWFGNFSGKGNEGISGTQIAAPAVFNAFAEIYSCRDIPEWYVRPANVKTRQICSLSGKRPGKFCTNLTNDLFIPGVTSDETCAIEKEAVINTVSGHEVCTACEGKESGGTEKRFCLDYAGDIAEFLIINGMVDRNKLLPPHSPLCPNANAKNSIEITSPRDMSRFFVIKGIAREMQAVILKAQKNGSENTTAYWFIDGEFFRESAINQDVPWRPVPGRHAIICTDEFGNHSNITIEVE